MRQTRVPRNLLAVLSLLASAAGVVCPPQATHAAGPRDPLTFQNAGLYGGTDITFAHPASEFDFYVVQAIVYEGQDNTAWANWLSNARQQGKRVIANFIPQVMGDEGSYYGVANHAGPLTDAQMERLADVATDFFSQVNPEDLYGMTIGEEHIFWDGQREVLDAMYDKLKARTSVPVFQWYSPASEGTAPGLNGWYNLKSDGWVSDEYYLDAPHMERNMRHYTVQQKPITNIMWAGGDANSVPFVDERFDHQVTIHQKYDIPMSFFTWSGILGVGSGFAPYPNPDPSTREHFEKVLDAIKQARNAPAADVSQWDSVPWEIPTIDLALSSNPTRASYVENYKEDRIVRFVNDAAITGFANLRWDSTAVELRPRQAGVAQASVAYTLQSPGDIAYLKVNAPAFVTAGTASAVTMSVYDSSGRLLKSAPLNPDGTLSLGVSGALLDGGRQFKVVYSMTGTASAAGQVLAGVDSIRVETILGSRPLFELDKTFDLADPSEQSQWSISLGPTGPHGPQFNASTLRYDMATNTYYPYVASEVRITPASDTANGKGDVTLIRRFDAGDGEIITDPVFGAWAHAFSSWGTSVRLWLSKDGVTWDVASNEAALGYRDQYLVADATGIAGYENLASVWLKIQLYDIYAFGDPDETYVHAWDLRLRGLTTVEPIPEPSSAALVGLGLLMLGAGRQRASVQPRTAFDRTNG